MCHKTVCDRNNMSNRRTCDGNDFMLQRTICITNTTCHKGQCAIEIYVSRVENIVRGGENCAYIFFSLFPLLFWFEIYTFGEE